MTLPAPEWQNATLALTLLAVDPEGLNGIWVRARSGPPRDRFIAALTPALAALKIRKLHPSMTDDQLFGGLDLTATLDQGRSILTEGILNGSDNALVLSMAERTEPSLCAKLAQSIDTNPSNVVIALDEGVEDEKLPETLADRLAFHIDLDGLHHADCPEISMDSDSIEIARRQLILVSIPAELISDVAKIALQFGINSLRAPSFVLRAARALAAMQRKDQIDPSDLAQAAALIFGPRATMVPTDQQDQNQAPDQPDPSDDEDQSQKDGQNLKAPDELLVDAIAAALPKGLLDSLAEAKAGRIAQGANGSGDAKKGNRRGRPKPSQRGRLGGAARIDLIATLRAAAPWQTMRRNAAFAPSRPIHIRAADIRLKRFEEKSDRLLIFAVDASGSAALARLAEAKGAVELLLSEAYSRRDHVALIAFRGETADILLPPTRSLVQTKRRLASLVGGGGTPLAMGLQTALKLAESTRNKGLTPTIALLTDGRANIALDGTPGRITAAQDASTVARLIRARQTPALVIDTGNRPQAALKELASELQAPYLPLPRADAHSVSQAIEAVLE